MNDAVGRRVLYAREPALSVDEFRRVLIESGLGALRSIDDEQCLRSMLSSADMVLTARRDEPGRPLVGVARLPDAFWYRRER
jgi:hypothetical protein